MERIPLTDQDVAYLVGRSGATRMRLERFSGARLSIDRDVAEVEGNPEERALAKLAISITLQQRNGGQVTTDFDELEDRDDVSTFDVPKETVGFLLGAKGSTLRQMETNHRVFMFFDNERVRTSKHVRLRPSRCRSRMRAHPTPAATAAATAQGRRTLRGL
jgi:rRNA processing protein Krr1/Pno1